MPDIKRHCVLIAALGVAQASAQDVICSWTGQGFFGRPAESAGDVDFDGVPDVLIGDWGYSGTSSNQGAAYVQSGGDCSNLLHQFVGANAGDKLGCSVAGVGDVNGDGHSDLLVGVPGSSAGGYPGAGEALLHSGMDGSVLWSVIGGPAPNGFTGDLTGHAVAAVGDVDLDGFPDWAVSSLGEGVVGFDAGVVRVHRGLSSSTPLVLTDTSEKSFGNSVSGAGDANGDGHADVVVGSYGNAGRVTLFSGQDGSTLWGVAGAHPMGRFGHEIDGAGDVNDDSFADVIAGSSIVDQVFKNAGRAAVLSGPTGGVLFDVYGTFQDAFVGRDVAGVGDVNGDGRADIAICSRAISGSAILQTYSVMENHVLTTITDGPFRASRGGDLDGDGTLDIIATVASTTAPQTDVRAYSGRCGSAITFGSGCLGTAGFVPKLDATGDCLPQPSQPLTLTIENGLGGETALLVFGAAKAAIRIGWCTLHVAPLIGPVIPIPLGGSGPGTGSANLSLTVPASAAGATFLMQAILTDPNTTIGYSASNGLELRVQ